MAEHTSGQWKWDYAPSVFVETDDGTDTITLASVDPDNDLPLEEAIANAILFHSSPDLLLACQRFLALMANWHTEQCKEISYQLSPRQADELIDIASVAQNAIAKAIGATDEV